MAKSLDLLSHLLINMHHAACEGMYFSSIAPDRVTGQLLVDNRFQVSSVYSLQLLTICIAEANTSCVMITAQ